MRDDSNDPIDEAFLETFGLAGRWKLGSDFFLELRHWGVSLIHVGYRDSESELELNGIKTRGQLYDFLHAVDPNNYRTKVKDKQ